MSRLGKPVGWLRLRPEEDIRTRRRVLANHLGTLVRVEGRDLNGLALEGEAHSITSTALLVNDWDAGGLVAYKLEEITTLYMYGEEEECPPTEKNV